jgi:hypothetical protein
MSKKLIALTLSAALTFSAIVPAFAAEGISRDAQAAKDLGMLKGSDGGVTTQYLQSSPTRIQAAILFLRLKGLENTALSYKGTNNFADASEMKWDQGRNIMAYLKDHPELGWTGIGNNKFNPNSQIDVKSYYKVMLEALGYAEGTDFQWNDVLTFAASKDLKSVAGTTNFVVDNIATATMEALKAGMKSGNNTLIASLIESGVVSREAAVKAGLIADQAEIKTTAASSAKSFKVSFKTAVADPSKVSFQVKRNSVAVAVTAAWNDTKTEATLTYAGVLPEGDYTVAVKEGTNDLGSKTVSVTKQKVDKIEILGNQLSVAPTTAQGSGNGYAAYQVFDQYGVDITNTSLANGKIEFNASVGTVESAKDGLITIKPFSGTVLTQYPTATVTGVCTESAVSATKSLTVSLSQGTLSGITLNKVVNADNKEVYANDTITKFYIDYTALDVNGNATKSSTLVKNGLMLTGTPAVDLISSNPTVLGAKVVTDPADSSKTAIELQVKGYNVYSDTPVIITAMTKSGKSSSITINVKKQATLDKLTLMAPSVLIAEGDKNVVIPYEAFDQNGNQLTSYDDIMGKFQVPTNNLKFIKNADGTLKITTGNATFTKGVPTVFQIVTDSGKASMITLKADATAIANDVIVDSSVVKQFMQSDAVQSMDLGASYGGFKVLDQYGRTIDLTSAATDGYYVKATVTSGSDLVSVTGDAKAYAGNKIEIKSNSNGKYGTATITFDLMKSGETQAIATKTMSMTVVDTKDITGITVGEIPTLYANAKDSSDKDNVKAYGKSIKVYGKLNNGGVVALSGTFKGTISYYVDNNNFMVDGTNVRAKKLDTGVNEATGKLTATVLLNGSVKTVSTALKSTSAIAAAQSINVNVTAATSDVVTGSVPTGFTVSGDTVTGTVAAINGLTSESFFAYLADGSENKTSNVVFEVKDQYGKTAMDIARIMVVGQTTGGAKYSIADGKLVVTDGTVKAGDTFVVTAIASNGLSTTVNFVVGQ